MTKTKRYLDRFDPMFEKVGQLTKLQRLLICIGAFVLLVGAFFYFMYLPKIKQIDALNNEKTSLQQQLVTAKKKAAQLEEYRAKMKKAQEDFTIAKAVLPEEREIPSLLISISQSGKDAGLEFLLWQPKSEVLKDFYAEIPVDMKVTGNYHNVATFFDNVSRLYRIVNIGDIEMKSQKDGVTLDTACTAVTYRFIEPKEQPEETTTNRRTRR